MTSPFLGPGYWAPVSTALRVQGDAAEIIRCGPLEGPNWFAQASQRIAEIAGRESVVVVHSGTGAFVPSIFHAIGAERSAGVIFVDATLPHPGRSWLDTAPCALGDRVRRLATDGQLPPWNQWFDTDPLTRLIPDPAVQAELRNALTPTPLAFLEAVAPEHDEWLAAPRGYLRLSSAYDEEARIASEDGWIVERLDAHHLAMVTAAKQIAQSLTAMAGLMA